MVSAMKSGQVTIGGNGKAVERPLTEHERYQLALVARRMGMPDGFAGLPKLCESDADVQGL
jgi:hypothetical protein